MTDIPAGSVVASIEPLNASPLTAEDSVIGVALMRKHLRPAIDEAGLAILPGPKAILIKLERIALNMAPSKECLAMSSFDDQ
jgi:hypothetical protein